jgi:hypothetical protein
MFWKGTPRELSVPPEEKGSTPMPEIYMDIIAWHVAYVYDGETIAVGPFDSRGEAQSWLPRRHGRLAR